MSCCAPCSAGAIQQLANGDIAGVSDFIVLFFNPNIFPESEYTKRLDEQIKYCKKLGVKYAIGNYDHAAWRAHVAGLENAPERGARCSLCFEFRFKYAAEFARKNGIPDDEQLVCCVAVGNLKDQFDVPVSHRISVSEIAKWVD